jgi:AcrR family transcriptional regulator
MTMEEVAKRARVGKQTLYKWWPTKAALVMSMFSDRSEREQGLFDATCRKLCRFLNAA